MRWKPAWEVEAVEVGDRLRKRLAGVKVEVEEERRLLMVEMGQVDLRTAGEVEALGDRLILAVEAEEGWLRVQLHVQHCLGEEAEVVHLTIGEEEAAARWHRCFVRGEVVVQRAVSSPRKEVGPRILSAVAMVMQPASCPKAPSVGVGAVVAPHLRLDWLLCFVPALGVVRCAPICRHLQWAAAL